MEIPVEDYKQGPGILEHFPEATLMGTLLEANQVSEHKPDNRINNPPATTGTWLFQSLPSAPPELQLYSVPVLGESPECEAPPPRMQNLPKRKRSSRNH